MFDIRTLYYKTKHSTRVNSIPEKINRTLIGGFWIECTNVTQPNNNICASVSIDLDSMSMSLRLWIYKTNSVSSANCGYYAQQPTPK